MPRIRKRFAAPFRHTAATRTERYARFTRNKSVGLIKNPYFDPCSTHTAKQITHSQSGQCE